MVREDEKLTQWQLADKMCVSHGTISHRETGVVKLTSEDCRRLLKVLPKINLHWLITGEGEQWVA